MREHATTVYKTVAGPYGFRQVRDGSLDRCRNIEAFDSEPKGWFLSRDRNRSEHFRCYFAMVKFRGTLCMRSHISLHHSTTKYFSNLFVFKKKLKRKDFQAIARLAWAQEAPGSNPGAPTI
jgi:hypothetical protein